MSTAAWLNKIAQEPDDPIEDIRILAQELCGRKTKLTPEDGARLEGAAHDYDLTRRSLIEWWQKYQDLKAELAAAQSVIAELRKRKDAPMVFPTIQAGFKSPLFFRPYTGPTT